MKIFLSHKMSGLTEDEVKEIRSIATYHLKKKYGSKIEIVDNYHHDDAPYNAGRLWHLGRSIQMLDDVDAIYFCKGKWHKAKGCWIERFIAIIYKIKVLK